VVDERLTRWGWIGSMTMSRLANRSAQVVIEEMMMLAYNLFLLFKIDFLMTTEYRQQIKTFSLMYIFLAGKIIRTARRVVMKLSENIHIERFMEIVCLDELPSSPVPACSYFLI
jgi:hypothetical protein